MTKKPKLTAKQERFAQLVAAGETLIEAQRQAFDRDDITSNGDYVDASVLAASPKVSLRIEELQAEYNAAAGITQTRVLAEVAALAFANIGDVATWDADGVSLKPSKDLSHDAMRSVREITENVTGTSRNLKVRQHSKEGALELLGRHVGLFAEHSTSEVHVTHELKGFSVEERRALLDDLEGQRKALQASAEVVDDAEESPELT